MIYRTNLLHARVQSQSKRFRGLIAKYITLLLVVCLQRIHALFQRSCMPRLALVCVTLFFLLRSIPITSAGPQPIISKLKCTQHASIVPGPHDDASPVISTRSETKKERSGKDRSLRIEIDVAADRTIAVSASRNTAGQPGHALILKLQDIQCQLSLHPVALLIALVLSSRE